MEGSVGDKIQIPGFGTFKVAGLHGKGPGKQATAGTWALGIQIAISSDVAVRLTEANFTLIASQRPLSRVTNGVKPSLKLPRELKPGKKARGFLTYEIPEGGDPVLTFLPPGTTTTVILRLASDVSAAYAEAHSPTRTSKSGPKPLATPGPRPKPVLLKPTPKPSAKKTVRLKLYETYEEGDPWYKFATGERVIVWCPKGYEVLSGGYEFTYPGDQEVSSSRPVSKSGREGWAFKVHIIWHDSGAIGQERGELTAVCRS